MAKRCPICAQSFSGGERFCPTHGLPLVEERIAIDKAGELSGEVLDNRYRLAGVAGRGGMGVVYEAENLRIGRRCAVKVLHPALHTDEKMRMRLFREVQATSRIRHSGVVEILDYGHDAKAGSYLVMEYLDGASLGTIIRDNAPLPLPFALGVAVQLSAALSATHAHGLIHRDLKPSNIRVLAAGRVKVLDFGLVKPFERETREEFLTISTGGIAFGTPWYMSPEQAGFEPLDQRSDIYSLGVVMYEMLTGRPPFIDSSPLKVIDAHVRKPIPLPSALDPPVEVAPSVEMLMLRALSKSPDERYQSMAEVTDALYHAAAQCGIDLGSAEAAFRSAAGPLSDTAVNASLPPQELEGSDSSVLPLLSGDLEIIAGHSGATVAEGARVGLVPAADELDDATVQTPRDIFDGFTVRVADAEAVLPRLQELMRARLPELSRSIVESLREMIPRYRTIEQTSVEAAVSLLVGTALDHLGESPPEGLPKALAELVSERTKQHFTLTEVIGALWMGYVCARPLVIQGAEADLERYDHMMAALDGRVLPFMLRVVDSYIAKQHGRLVQLGESLSRRNEELEHLRGQLADRVRQTTSQLAAAEQLKARVADSISSGLLLVERGTRRVMMYNRALEKLTGLPGSQILDRPLDEIMGFVDGVPSQEFIEQIRLHGEVGLRKLRLRLKNSGERAVYVRGQGFGAPGSDQGATLFIIDDVTEREQIIESFSRYVSRDVADRVLRQGRGLAPGAEPQSAVLLAVNICGFRKLVGELSPEALVELLTDYLRVVSDAVFHRGGVVDTVVADGVLIYFKRKDSCAPALDAAIDLVNRLAALNKRREKQDKPPVYAGVGLHLGKVLVVNVGGNKRMVQTVVGEAAQVALALRDVADGGEVLVTDAVHEEAKETHSFAAGPVIAIDGHDEPRSAWRLIYQPKPRAEPTTIN